MVNRLGCLLALFVGLLLRLAPFIHWVVRLAPVDAAFDTFLIPLLGIIFLRFGTSIEVILYVPGIGLNGRRWFWVILAAWLMPTNGKPPTPGGTRCQGTLRVSAAAYGRN